MPSRIPKRIIQTGKHLDQSLRNRAVMSNLRLLNPDFEYLFFDNKAVEDFIDQEFPQYGGTFRSFRFPIQRYDFFRYLAIYRYGGFYFDLDVLLAGSLSNLLELDCVFPFEGLTFSHLLRNHYRMDWEIGNYAFGARANHPFLKAIIKNCIRAQNDPEWVKPMMRGLPFLSKTDFFVLNTTGPGLVTRTLAESQDLVDGVTVLFPEDVCDLTKWNCFGDMGIHLMEGSWRSHTSRIRQRLAQYFEIWKMHGLVKQSRKLGKIRQKSTRTAPQISAPSSRTNQDLLVSILIPAFNAEKWIADTLTSAVAQTWQRKEIIVVDDGSSDRTAIIARQFEPYGVRVITQTNQGAAAARNKAFSLSHGDYIQWLDADDLLAPDKIERQMQTLERSPKKRMLLSAAWGRFLYRYTKAEFEPTALWCDLSPREWLLRKMEQNVFMQTATWLVSRHIAEAAGPWNTDLLGDDDGEYFCRVLLASDGVRFVPDARVYYRTFGYDSLGYIGRSERKCEAHWLSMQLHIRYLRSLEDSEAVRRACLRYLRNSLIYFYPEQINILNQVNEFALSLGESLGEPCLSWKYSWVKAAFGWSLAKRFQVSARKTRWRGEKLLDYVLFRMERKRTSVPVGSLVQSTVSSFPQAQSLEIITQSDQPSPLLK